MTQKEIQKQIEILKSALSAEKDMNYALNIQHEITRLENLSYEHIQ